MSEPSSDNRPRSKARRRWVLLGGLFVLWASITFVPDLFFPERDKELRSHVRQAVAEEFPEQAAEIAGLYGLRRLDPRVEPSPDAPPASSAVVLVHGLDDPGKVWMKVAPELLARGFDVWELRYPNDQPIHDSALFFARTLSALADEGITRVAVVSHSMGGLVTREMLTHPDIDYSKTAARGDVPLIQKLIMVGTPNHGSQLARFRALGEFREQAVAVASGRGHLLAAILDGAGEAGIDLVPGSQFLEKLNARPHPAGLRMLIVAGVVAAPDGDAPPPDAPDGTGPTDDSSDAAVEAWLQRMSHGLGDGMVTVDSSRLEGVRHQIVDGNHMSIVRNIRADSERVPPAVPIIIEELNAAGPEPPAPASTAP